MKTKICHEIREKILSGDEFPDSTMIQHLESCSACEEAYHVVAALKQDGAQGRCHDLSDDTQKQTRRRVAEVLPSGRKESVFWFRPLAPWGWAVATSLCLLILLLVLPDRHPSVSSFQASNKTDHSVGVQEIDQEIQRMQSRLNYEIAQLQAHYVRPTHASSFESRRDAMRDRIQMCSSGIHSEFSTSQRRDIKKSITL